MFFCQVDISIIKKSKWNSARFLWYTCLGIGIQLLKNLVLYKIYLSLSECWGLNFTYPNFLKWYLNFLFNSHLGHFINVTANNDMIGQIFLLLLNIIFSSILFLFHTHLHQRKRFWNFNRSKIKAKISCYTSQCV